jgi:DivIVA domain-containing protein
MSIERPTFATTMMRTGYDMAAVDDAVDRVMAALTLPDPGISAAEIEALAFAPVSYRRGYDMGNVDDWLDDVVDELRRRGGDAAVDAAPVGTAPPAEVSPVSGSTSSGAIVEVDTPGTRVLVVVALVVVFAVLLYVSLS